MSKQIAKHIDSPIQQTNSYQLLNDLSLAESYEEDKFIRINSAYPRAIYYEIEKILHNMDFRDSRFDGRFKRNRSMGSAQAFLVELLLTDDQLRARLGQILPSFMLKGGRNYAAGSLPWLRYRYN